MHAIFCEKRGRRERKERGKKGGGKERKRRGKVLVVAVLCIMWLVPVLSVYFYVAMAKGRLRVQLLLCVFDAEVLRRNIISSRNTTTWSTWFTMYLKVDCCIH